MKTTEVIKPFACTVLTTAFVTTAGVLVAIAAGAMTAHAQGTPAPRKVVVVAEQLFVPPGFDSNDNAQITIHGNLISTCYKSIPPKVRVDPARREVTIAAQALWYSGCFCADIMIPFQHTMDLGILPAGNYTVTMVDDQNKVIHQAALPVAVARTAAPDNEMYLPVDQAMVEKRGGSPFLILTGKLTNDCVGVDRVKLLHRVPNIIEVLPLATYHPGPACKRILRPFSLTTALPSTGQAGDTLIHVRALNGRSLNVVEDLTL